MLKKNPALLLAVLLSLIFIVLAWLEAGFIESLEMTTYDMRMGLRASGPDTETDIAIVDIDDDSITKLGRWPWPRSLIARMVRKLDDAGANVIALNVIFSEPEVAEGLKLIEDLREDFARQFAAQDGAAAQAFLQRLTSAADTLDTDQRLTEAMQSTGNVVLPVFFQLGMYAQAAEDFPDPILENGIVHAQGGPAGQYMIPAKNVTTPIDSFSEAAVGLGHINILPDPDGAVRRALLLVNYKGLPFPSFSLRLAALSQGIQNDQIHIITPEEGREGVRIGQVEAPTSPNFDFYITFTDSRAFSTFSFFDVLNDKVETTALKGKTVIIGVSATGVDAPQVTPLDNRMPTSLIAANTLHNLTSGGFITRSGMMSVVELVILVVVGLFLSLLLPRLKARQGAVASIALLAVIVGAGVYLFVGMGIWFKITYPVLLVVLGYAAVTTTRYFVTEVVKDKVEGESAEINRMLGLNFQTQGMLDMAFDKFRRAPVDEGMKDILYNLALDYERKRMFNKAVSVYEYIKQHDEAYRDITDKIKKLTVASETMIFGLSGGSQSEGGTLVIDENTKPTLGRYEVQKELGKGAMGIVYMGKDPKIGRVTAIKTIRFSEEYEENEAEKLKEQFFREAETAGMLSHPNIVTIYDAGEDHDLSYIAMEYLEGVDLKDYVERDKLLPIREVLRVIADVADALDYAHEKGVVHRDIKPANIMLLKSGVAKVTDFGIARATATSKTKTGVVKGTPFYMSPEQITGKKVDGRSDIFSLGVVLYEMLTGLQPFRADDLTALIYKITSEDPEPIQEHNSKVPRAIQQIIDKALVKDRERRYQRAGQMAEHLRIVGRKMDELAAKKGKA